MLKPDNKLDKKRFQKLKDAELERGRDPDEAADVAALEVKELRHREGRSKEDAETTSGTHASAEPNTKPAEPAGG